jgi:hypothetical protein
MDIEANLRWGCRQSSCLVLHLSMAICTNTAKSSAKSRSSSSVQMVHSVPFPEPSLVVFLTQSIASRNRNDNKTQPWHTSVITSPGSHQIAVSAVLGVLPGVSFPHMMCWWFWTPLMEFHKLSETARVCRWRLLIDCLFVCRSLSNFQLCGGCHYDRWQACKFRPMFSTYVF